MTGPTYADIIANPRLLQQMTQQESEVLTYTQQCARLRLLMRLHKPVTNAIWCDMSKVPF